MGDESLGKYVPGIFVFGENVIISWIDEEDDQERSVDLDFAVCATLLDIIDRHGIDHAYKIARAALSMARPYVGPVGFNQDATLQEAKNITKAIQGLDLQRGKLVYYEDEILEGSYHMLQAKEWTRAEAAEHASSLLGRNISTEAWRKAVDRFAEKNKLPKVEIHRRSKVKTDN